MPCVHELSLYLLAQLGDAAEVIGMNAGGTVETHGIRFTMVPAAHSSGDLMGGTDVRYFGEPAGFVLELENGFRVYDAGDTTVFGDMALIRELYAPDLAILPIGGHYTMDPAAAAVAVGLLGVHDVLPVHWGTFPILTGTPAPNRRPYSIFGQRSMITSAPLASARAAAASSRTPSCIQTTGMPRRTASSATAPASLERRKIETMSGTSGRLARSGWTFSPSSVSPAERGLTGSTR